MLVIRLFRVGKKNQPSFKIVVTEKKNPPRGGRFVEEVGFYNPLTKEKVVKKERIKYWLSQGVKPSDTIHNLLVKEGILESKKIPVHKKPKKKEAAPSGGEPRPAEAGRETPKEEKPAEKPPEKPKEEPPKEKPQGETPKKEEAPKENAPKEEKAEEKEKSVEAPKEEKPQKEEKKEK